MCLKLPITEKSHPCWHSYAIFTVDFEHNQQITQVFLLLLTLNK